MVRDAALQQQFEKGLKEFMKSVRTLAKFNSRELLIWDKFTYLLQRKRA